MGFKEIMMQGIVVEHISTIPQEGTGNHWTRLKLSRTTPPSLNTKSSPLKPPPPTPTPKLDIIDVFNMPGPSRRIMTYLNTPAVSGEDERNLRLMNKNCSQKIPLCVFNRPKWTANSNELDKMLQLNYVLKNCFDEIEISPLTLLLVVKHLINSNSSIVCLGVKLSNNIMSDALIP